MSKNIISGQAVAEASSQTNCESLYVIYNLTTPYNHTIGEPLDLKNVVNEEEHITISYQSQGKGTEAVAQKVPLLFFACLEGIKRGNMAYVVGAANPASEAAKTTMSISQIEFVIPVFKGGKRFQAGDSLDVSVFCNWGTVTIKNIDSPFAKKDSLPYYYRQRTVLANDDSDLEGVEKVFIPNNATKFDSLQLFGDSLVQFDLYDFYTHFSDEWVSNITPYRNSPYLGIDVSKFVDKKLKAGSSNLTYFFIQ